jgi:hypothetical protein
MSDTIDDDYIIWNGKKGCYNKFREKYLITLRLIKRRIVLISLLISPHPAMSRSRRYFSFALNLIDLPHSLSLSIHLFQTYTHTHFIYNTTHIYVYICAIHTRALVYTCICTCTHTRAHSTSLEIFFFYENTEFFFFYRTCLSMKNNTHARPFPRFTRVRC